MRISDWSSDVCSSDLLIPLLRPVASASNKRATLLTICNDLFPAGQMYRGRGKVLNSASMIEIQVGDNDVPHIPGIETQRPDLRHCRFFWTKLNIVEGKEEFRSEEHTSELQSLMRISYAVFS